MFSPIFLGKDPSEKATSRFFHPKVFQQKKESSIRKEEMMMHFANYDWMIWQTIGSKNHQSQNHLTHFMKNSLG